MALCKKQCAGRQLKKRQKRWKQSSGHALNWMRPLPLNDISPRAPPRPTRPFAPRRLVLQLAALQFSYSTNKLCAGYVLLLQQSNTNY